MKFSLSDHLIIPFGIEKWRIEEIRISGVSTSKTYFQSDVPVIHIDRNRQEPLRLGVVLENLDFEANHDKDTLKDVRLACQYLKTMCDARSAHEARFLDIYFTFVEESVARIEYNESDSVLGSFITKLNSSPPKNSPYWAWAAIFPIPQAHLYLSDPLRDRPGGEHDVPEHMVKVDFAFWLGRSLFAVEIDGSSHVGNEKHVWKDRWLQRAGVEVIHVLNGELDTHGKKIVDALMPKTIRQYWKGLRDDQLNDMLPFFTVPF